MIWNKFKKKIKISNMKISKNSFEFSHFSPLKAKDWCVCFRHGLYNKQVNHSGAGSLNWLGRPPTFNISTHSHSNPSRTLYSLPTI